MNFLKKLLGGSPKPRTLLDDVQEAGGKLIVSAYRRIAAQEGCAPTAKTTDQKIVEIYAIVGAAFHEAAGRRGERIPALYLNTIVLKFLQVYEMMGEQMLVQHLRYEVDKYLDSGLRPEYMQELPLIGQPVELAPQPSKSRPPRIVIVDDEPDLLQFMEIYIHRSFKHVTVLTFQDGQAAWQELSRTAPDLLITDIHRPGFTIWDMLPRLAERGGRYPILVVSGTADAETRRQLRERGGPRLNISLLSKAELGSEGFLKAIEAGLEPLEDSVERIG